MRHNGNKKVHKAFTVNVINVLHTVWRLLHDPVARDPDGGRIGTTSGRTAANRVTDVIRKNIPPDKLTFCHRNPPTGPTGPVGPVSLRALSVGPVGRRALSVGPVGRRALWALWECTKCLVGELVGVIVGVVVDVGDADAVLVLVLVSVGDAVAVLVVVGVGVVVL